VEEIEEMEAKYVLAVKENQPGLYKQIEEYFTWVENEQPEEEVIEQKRTGYEKEHGKIEQREVQVSRNIE
jgi:predicted transposase YbfD/YdcC